MRKIHIMISTFFWSGYFPFAPGTFATLVFIPVYIIVFSWMHPLLYLASTAAVYLAGTWSSNYAAVIFGRKDPSKVVIDEVAGFLVTMMFIPATPVRIIFGFIFSRLFDIVKPPPARQAESLRGGNGIMLDDVIAGIYGNLAMWAIVLSKADLYIEKLIQPLKIF